MGYKYNQLSVLNFWWKNHNLTKTVNLFYWPFEGSIKKMEEGGGFLLSRLKYITLAKGLVFARLNFPSRTLAAWRGRCWPAAGCLDPARV